jgi:uncharacterized protein (DUF4415 family)
MKKEYDFSNGVRGKFYRPAKVQKTIRLDADIIKHFQEMAIKQHTGYQTLINDTLREAMEKPSNAIDLTILRKELRAVIRRELAHH